MSKKNTAIIEPEKKPDAVEEKIEAVIEEGKADPGTPEAPATDSVVAPTALYKGKKEVKTQEELLAYVAELEKNLPPDPVESSAKLPEKGASSVMGDDGFGEPEAKKPSIDLSDNEKILAEFLTRPKDVVDGLADQVLAKVKQAADDEAYAKNAWKTFYETNKDIAPYTDIVDLVRKDLVAKLKKDNVSWETGSQILATEVRKIVKRIRGSDTEIEEVDTSKRNVSLSSSGNPAPQGVTETTSGNETFSQQVRMWQRGLRKKTG